MARKKLTLREWLKKDEALKLEFLEYECSKEKAVLWEFQTPNGTYQIEPKEKIYDPFLIEKISNQKILLINEKYFFDLKNGFRNFKYSKKNRTNVRKQFYLTSHISKKLEALTEKLKQRTEAECLEFLINDYDKKQTTPPTYKQKLYEKDSIIEELNNRIKALDKALYVKQLQVRKQDQAIQDYLINELINCKIVNHELKNHAFKEANEIQKSKHKLLKEIQNNIQLEQLKYESIDTTALKAFWDE